METIKVALLYFALWAVLSAGASIVLLGVTVLAS